MITAIYIIGGKLDLFSSDNITLKSSITELGDITKVFTDSTNSFSVPATDNNNKLFKHFYDADLLDGWNVFEKVQAVIELDGFLYKEGKVQLNRVITKSQQPVSYNIQFYGLLTSLIDILGDTKLSELDFSAYDFELNSSNVLANLTSFLTYTPDIINTTLSTRRMIYDSSSSVNNTTEIKNIALNNTGLTSGLEWNYTGTSILNIRIIEAIESHFGITFSRDFFGTSQFNNLYMLLNGGNLENVLEEQVVFDVFTSDPTLENDRILLSTTLPFDTTVNMKISIDCDGANHRDEFTSVIKANGVEIHSITGKGNSSGIFSYVISSSDFEMFENLTFHFKSNSFLTYKYTVDRLVGGAPSYYSYKSEKNPSTLEGYFNVSEKMPDLTVIEYLKGLFMKDKLIAIGTSDTKIYVNSLDQYYKSGEVKDISKHIDYSEVPISTGVLFSEINYKFKEPSTILAKQFYENNGRYYGDLEYKITDDNGKASEGDSIDIELPFENMVYERIYDVSGADEIIFMYGYMADDSLNAVTVKPHLHYAVTLATNDYIKILLTSATYTQTTRINIPSHTLGFNSPQYSTVFGEEFNEYNGVRITNTIYKNSYEDFISNAFNRNKRLYVFKAKDLPTDFLLNLKLNDVLEIKDKYYRINTFNINIITKECEFEVYNIKNLNLTPKVSYTWDNSEITFDTTEITFDKV